MDTESVNGWTPVQVGTTRAQRERGYTEAWSLVHHTGQWDAGEPATTREGALRIARNLPSDPDRAERLHHLAIREWCEDIVKGIR